MRKFISVLLTITTIFSVSGCSALKENKYPASSTEYVLNTVASVTIYGGENISDPLDIINQSFDLCTFYENIFSRTINGSEADIINKSGGSPVDLSDDMADILAISIKYGELSKGGLDVTIEPISKLWDFHAENPTVPDSNTIAQNLQYVDYTNIKLDGNEVTLQGAHSALDLGAVAKGYIADKMKVFLIENGVTSGIINLGGNVLAIGQRTDGTPFSIGVQDPFGHQNAVLGSLDINDKSVVTSGVYERFFEYDGATYHHILDPNTGYPVDNSLQSVTIISDMSVDGDALSTSCFVLGADEGMALINSLENIEAIFITKDSQYVFSDGIGKTIIFKELNNE